MRIRVRVDPWMPLVAGFMLRLDNGDRIWIQCRYERVYKVCTKCGLIGHNRPQCTYLLSEVEHFLHTQRQRIQQRFQVQYGFDPLQPHFVNELRAFYNRSQRRNTQIRFGPLTKDTGYRYRQYQRGGAPPPHTTTHDPFPSTAQDPLASGNAMHDPSPLHANSDLHTQDLHATGPALQNPSTLHVPPDHIPSEPIHINNTPPGSPSEHAPPTNPLWQPPDGSNLHWVWIENEGPFLTNAMLLPPHTTCQPLQKAQNSFNFEVCFDSYGRVSDSKHHASTLATSIHILNDPQPPANLSSRMMHADFHFEDGESSQNPVTTIAQDNLQLESSFAQFNIASTSTNEPNRTPYSDTPEAQQLDHIGPSVSLKVLIPINWLINPRIFM